MYYYKPGLEIQAGTRIPAGSTRYKQPGQFIFDDLRMVNEERARAAPTLGIHCYNANNNIKNTNTT